MSIKTGVLLMVCCILPFTFIYPQTIVNKNAGIGFRIDDNHLESQFSTYANVFRKYGYNFTFALNLSESHMARFPHLIDTAKKLIMDGNEMADHTPSHTTKLFNVINTNPYYGKSGVDHIINSSKTVCLKWGTIDTNTVTGEGKINVSGNLVTSNSPGEFTNMGNQNTIYFNGKLYTFNPNNVITGPVRDTIKGLMSYWGEPINLPAQTNIKYHKIYDYDVHLHPDALKILAQASLDYCDRHNIPYPHSWIQPGGAHPQLWKQDVASVLGTLGYTSGATYPNAATKFFNDYNPQNLQQYAIQWGDFREDMEYLPLVKKDIANRIARNMVAIGHSHFIVNGTWNQYLARMDSLLAWCQEKNIPVYTYSKWADILYNIPQNPYVNIIPKLNRDLDGDNIPDGYTLSTGTIIDNSDYPAGSIAKKSLVQNAARTFFQIQSLGGLEKGKNYFSFYAKGHVNSQIKVTMVIYAGSVGLSRSFDFKITSGGWQKFELINALPPDSTQLYIPENAAFMLLTVACSKYFNSSSFIKIADFELRKFTPETIIPPFLNKTVFVNNANNVKWDINSTNQIKFVLQRKYQGEPSFRSIASVGPTISTVKDSMLDFPELLRDHDTASVYYRVIAINSSDSSTSNIDQVVVPVDQILPVELTSFSGNFENKKIVLHWSTATELKNYGFDIERKRSGNWNKIGFVKGSGCSNSPKNYSFTDSDLSGGNLITYRLKQIDLDGEVQYSYSIQVSLLPKEFELLQNYPNPFNPSTTISYSVVDAGLVTLKLYDILGREVAVLFNQYHEPGYYKYILILNGNTGNLSSGMYIYTLQSHNKVLVKKMLLLK